MDWGYALAGGAYAVGDAYGEEQKKQREWKREQATADAAQVRKENFARFGIEIDKQKAQDRSQVALAQHKATSEYDKTVADSGYIDPQTKMPVTNEELKKRGGTEGLVPKADWESEQKTKRTISETEKLSKAKTEAGLKEIQEMYKDDPDKLKAAVEEYKRKRLGLYAEDSTQRSSKKNAQEIVKGVGKLSQEISEVGGVNKKDAPVFAMADALRTVSDMATIKELASNPMARQAMELDKNADTVLSSVQYPTEDAIMKAHKAGELKDAKGKPISSTEIKRIIAYIDYNGQLEDSKLFRMGD